MRDDSRPLTGDETVETMPLRQVIDEHDKRNIGVIHGSRYTWVHGFHIINPQPELGGGSSPSLVCLVDCYGDEIPGTYGHRNVTVRAVTADHPH